MHAERKRKRTSGPPMRKPRPLRNCVLARQAHVERAPLTPRREMRPPSSAWSPGSGMTRLLLLSMLHCSSCTSLFWLSCTDAICHENSSSGEPLGMPGTPTAA